MTVIIISQEGCSKCAEAIAHYRARGIEPEIHHDLIDIADKELRRDLMAEIMVERPSGDPMRVPIVFEDGKLVEWEG